MTHLPVYDGDRGSCPLSDLVELPHAGLDLAPWQPRDDLAELV